MPSFKSAAARELASRGAISIGSLMGIF